MEFYKSSYNEKYGQRLECDLYWQLWEEEKKKKKWEVEAMKLDALKENKKSYVKKMSVYNDILIDKSYKKI